MTQSLFIAWRAVAAGLGHWGPVGRLDCTELGYRFVYTRGAQMLPGFEPFPGMTDLEAVYESTELLPLFANRLLAPSRREYKSYLHWSGFDPAHPPDPIAILGVTEGRRQTDSLEVFPCPTLDANGCCLLKFFLHGIQNAPDAAHERIQRLEPNEKLVLAMECGNESDVDAVSVRTLDLKDRYLIGYVPRYVARDVRRLFTESDCESVELTVERVNQDAPSQLRLLCRMKACWPTGLRPCDGEEYRPIVPEHDSVAH